LEALFGTLEWMELPFRALGALLELHRTRDQPSGPIRPPRMLASFISGPLAN